VYPNPNNGTFTVEGLAGQSLELLDVSGRIIATKRVIESQMVVEIQNPVNGLYFVRAGSYLIPVKIQR
jgi:hypothetical protein